MSGVSLACCIDLITRAAAASGQTNQAVFFQQVSQVSRRCRLGDLCDRLVLRRADAVFEALLTTVEQSIENLDLFSRQRDVAGPRNARSADQAGPTRLALAHRPSRIQY